MQATASAQGAGVQDEPAPRKRRGREEGRGQSRASRSRGHDAVDAPLEGRDEDGADRESRVEGEVVVGRVRWAVWVLVCETVGRGQLLLASCSAERGTHTSQTICRATTSARCEHRTLGVS